MDFDINALTAVLSCPHMATCHEAEEHKKAVAGAIHEHLVMAEMNERLSIRIGLLLEPVDAKSIGQEIKWLLQQEGNVGTASFQVMRAFAQKNLELARHRLALDIMVNFPKHLEWMNPTERIAFALKIIDEKHIIRYPTCEEPVTYKYVLTDEGKSLVKAAYPEYKYRAEPDASDEIEKVQTRILEDAGPNEG